VMVVVRDYPSKQFFSHPAMRARANQRLRRLLATELSSVLGLNFAGCHRCSARRSVLISTAALKELAMAIPAATHKTI
jgi:hypothetical protein